MRLIRLPRALAIMAIAVLMAAPCASPQSSASSDREIDREVEALLKQMTVEEKIGQLTQSFHFVNNAKSDQGVLPQAQRPSLHDDAMV